MNTDAADARRYRWLRDHSHPGICAFYLSVGMALHGVRFTSKTVDEAIDAAINGPNDPDESEAPDDHGEEHPR